MSVETWKDIPGFEGLYQVSDQGRVRSLDRKVLARKSPRAKPHYRKYRGMLLRPAVTGGGLCVVLGRAAGTRYIHVLVAAAFLGPRPPGYDVCHNNGDNTDNQLSNLRYGTRSENNIDIVMHERRWLPLKTVRTIKAELKKGGRQRTIAEKHGVSEGVVSQIKVGRSYRYV